MSPARANAVLSMRYNYYNMSVITQYGDSALMMAAREGRTEVVPLLLEARADIHLLNMVNASECVYRSMYYIQL